MSGYSDTTLILSFLAVPVRKENCTEGALELVVVDLVRAEDGDDGRLVDAHGRIVRLQYLELASGSQAWQHRCGDLEKSQGQLLQGSTLTVTLLGTATTVVSL